MCVIFEHVKRPTNDISPLLSILIILHLSEFSCTTASYSWFDSGLIPPMKGMCNSMP